MNNTPFLNRQQWQKMLHWLPEDLWQRVRPKVAVQDDVNGFPRAGALALLDRGIHRLFTGINERQRRPAVSRVRRPSGGRCPTAAGCSSTWAIAIRRAMISSSRWNGVTGRCRRPATPAIGRRGPAISSAATRPRCARRTAICSNGFAAWRRKAIATRCCCSRSPISGGSTTTRRFRRWPISWPRGTGLELKPTLRLTTAAVAMKRLEEEIGAQVPEYQGEWTDWWANGTASAPREVAASRIAKRLLEAAESPLWGQWNASGRRTVDELLRDLCLFDEHTWGSSNSVALPYSLDTQAQFNEKASLAFRPMARAEWLLAQRVRSRLAAEGEGLYVANSSPLPWSGWVRMPGQRVARRLPFAGRPQVGRQDEAVLRERFSALHAAAESERIDPREHGRHVSRQLPSGRSSSSGWKGCRARASASCS